MKYFNGSEQSTWSEWREINVAAWEKSEEEQHPKRDVFKVCVRKTTTRKGEYSLIRHCKM